jgi:pimeloyl-ACP methyl ester carboxylesterase
MPEPPTNLVLLPGLDGSDALLEPLCGALARHVRPCVVPLPAAGPNDYDSLTQHVRERIRGMASPVILAWSFSGPIGIRLAADPEVAPRALVLAASFARNPHPYLRHAGWLAQPWLLAPFLHAAPAERLLAGRSAPALRPLLRRAHAALSARVLAERVRAVLGVDERAILASLRLPVLYLRSSHDLVVPSASSRLISELCPHARVGTLEGPHLALASQPERAAAQILSFLGSSTMA